MTIAIMETNNAKSPNISLEGNDTRKSSSAYLDVKIDKKITIDVEEEHSATASDRINILNQFIFRRIGSPDTSLFPPGTVKAAAKTTVAINVATSIHDVAVSFIHFSPSFRNSLCPFVKSSCATSPSLFFDLMYERGTIFFTA